MTSTNSSVFTPEQGEKLVNDCRIRIIKIKEKFHIDTYRNDESVCDNVKSLREGYYAFKHAGVQAALEYRKRVGMELLEHGVAEAMCHIILHSLKTGWLTGDGERDVDIHYPFYNSLIVLLNFSDACPKLGVELCRTENFMETLISTLQNFYERTVDKVKQEHETVEQATRFFLCLIYNCSNIEENEARLRQLGLSSVLFCYMNNKENERQCLYAVLALANILTEEESKQLQADTDGVKFLLTRLENALMDEQNLRSLGWSAKELAKGVERLATSCDENKMMLVDHGVLSSLNRMLELTGVEEQYASVCALLALSFAEHNKKKIITEPGMITRLNALRTTEEKGGVNEVAKCILWNLRENLIHYEEYKELGLELRQLERGSDTNNESHIMISYNWKQQHILLRVREVLEQRGYRTWMDVHDMSGSTLDSMADAVEKSAAVLICVSQHYKDSQFCRMELEYSVKRKKTMIPLMVQSGYRPDGWLGFVIGCSLYYDLSEKEQFTSKLESVCGALGSKGKPVNRGYDEVDTRVIEDSANHTIFQRLNSKTKGTTNIRNTPKRISFITDSSDLIKSNETATTVGNDFANTLKSESISRSAASINEDAQNTPSLDVNKNLSELVTQDSSTNIIIRNNRLNTFTSEPVSNTPTHTERPSTFSSQPNSNKAIPNDGTNTLTHEPVINTENESKKFTSKPIYGTYIKSKGIDMTTKRASRTAIENDEQNMTSKDYTGTSIGDAPHIAAKHDNTNCFKSGIHEINKSKVFSSIGTNTSIKVTELSGHIQNLDSEEMKDWLNNNSFSKNPRISKLTVKELKFLWELKSEAPEYFYRLAEKRLKLRKISDITMFVSDLTKLFS